MQIKKIMHRIFKIKDRNIIVRVLLFIGGISKGGKLLMTYKSQMDALSSNQKALDMYKSSVPFFIAGNVLTYTSGGALGIGLGLLVYGAIVDNGTSGAGGIVLTSIGAVGVGAGLTFAHISKQKRKESVQIC